jgi:hypothetical protein
VTGAAAKPPASGNNTLLSVGEVPRQRAPRKGVAATCSSTASPRCGVGPAVMSRPSLWTQSCYFEDASTVRYRRPRGGIAMPGARESAGLGMNAGLPNGAITQTHFSSVFQRFPAFSSRLSSAPLL